ncbi:hypothetical protein DNI29_22075 [Hymenobacter sediminis]|uniref:hypothetical protein n=1 Tax=Hymenobacter sediminis TaxID=2218621 RepID=UPI000DA670F6|nr:hypothetical protein [Hymenobacter sediminis]RPD44089.1 hypothetical protein DNI29_22075 [Hymenobacter sediminis]
MPPSFSSPARSGATATVLRTLRWELLHLSAADPYRAARLARLADQLDYVLQSWPVEQWPQGSADGTPLPTAAVLRSQLAALPSEAAAQQQALLSLVLRLL